ncbi:MAG: tetratricopeptide repeat protein [Bdellovibrionales bacterium]
MWGRGYVLRDSETPAATKEKDLDPLEELILENIVTSQVNSTDYFSEEKQDEIASDESEEDNLSEGNLENISVPVKATEIHIEPIPHQAGEVHSFAEWLHLNQKSDSKKEEKVEKKKVIVQAETPIPVAQPSPKTFEPRTIVSEKETTPISTAEVKNTREEIQIEVPAEKPIIDSAVNAPKMLYIKSTSPQPSPTPASHQKETSAPQSSPSLPAEKIPFSSISNTPLDTDPNLIPPKKPIPDPSLVDTDPPKSKVPADQLIDKFIKQEPRITPSKSAFYSPINMAKRSIIESDDIVSETLANIYAQQGNFQKAISFYTKLSLRFPEKSRYFAALIKELENKLNT